MSTQNRTILTILIVVAVSVTVLLTAGITPDTELRPGTTFYSDDETQPAETISTLILGMEGHQLGRELAPPGYQKR